jgi:hypothetical protein
LNEIDKTLVAQFSLGVIANKDFSDDMIACLAVPFGICWDFRRTGFSFTTSY